MTIYLDMCCLKRPFDDQMQPRVALETMAVLSILQAVAEGRARAVRSSAHDLENLRNPDDRRKAAVGCWLEQLDPIVATPATVAQRAETLCAAVGLRAVDTLHVAWAENLGAEYFVTVDSQLLAQARRCADTIGLTAIGPIELLLELAI